MQGRTAAACSARRTVWQGTAWQRTATSWHCNRPTTGLPADTSAAQISRSSQLSCCRSLMRQHRALHEIRSSHLPSSFVAQTYHSPKVIHNLTLLVPSAKNRTFVTSYTKVTHYADTFFVISNKKKWGKWKTFLHDKEAHNLAWSNNVADCMGYAKCVCGHPPKLGII